MLNFCWAVYDGVNGVYWLANSGPYFLPINKWWLLLQVSELGVSKLLPFTDFCILILLITFTD